MMSKKFIKGMCIFLAGLMVIGTLAALFQVFAAAPTPTTGVDDINPAVLIAGIVLCLLIIVMCILLPKFRKKEKK